MQKIKDITENEMISIFLKTEINSSRWSSLLMSLLAKDRKSRSIIDLPDITNLDENNFRKKLLGDFRGYGRNEKLFENFPTSMKWIRAKVNKDECEKIKYMEYSYWNELSNHTRLAIIGAETINSGRTIFNESNAGFLKAAEAVKQGITFPEMILVSKDDHSDLIILEGHQRITAYLLAYDYMPQELEVIVGYSKQIVHWGSY